MQPTQLGILQVYRQTAWSWQILNQDSSANPIDLVAALGTVWTGMTRPKPESATVFDFSIDLTKTAQGLITLSLDAAQTGLMPSPMGFDVFAAHTGQDPVAVYLGTLQATGAYTHA